MNGSFIVHSLKIVGKMTENMLSDALLSKGVQNFAAAPQASGGRCAGLPPLRGGFHFNFTLGYIKTLNVKMGLTLTLHWCLSFLLIR